MASSPQFKVYSPSGEYVASCKYPSDAAVLVSCYGDGATIRNGHTKASIKWTEGAEAQPAGESYDFVAECVYSRSN